MCSIHQLLNDDFELEIIVVDDVSFLIKDEQ